MRKKYADTPAGLDATRRAAPRHVSTAKRRRSAPEPEAIKQLTLYLNAGAHRELKLLAIDQDTKVHALVIEAVNDMFVKYGRKPVAILRVRSKPS